MAVLGPGLAVFQLSMVRYHWGRESPEKAWLERDWRGETEGAARASHVAVARILPAPRQPCLFARLGSSSAFVLTAPAGTSYPGYPIHPGLCDQRVDNEGREPGQRQRNLV